MAASLAHQPRQPPVTSRAAAEFGRTGRRSRSRACTRRPRGNLSAVTYDAARRKLEAKSYLGGTTASTLGAAARTVYDAVGRVIREEKATSLAGGTPTYGHVTTVTYTPTGQKAQVTDADGRVVRMQYDAVDRLIVTIDPENRRTRKVYDAAGQLLQEIRADATPLAQIYAEHAYSLNGKELSVKDAKTNLTSYVYDGFDRLLRTTFPDATFEELTYDVSSNVITKRTRANQIITNTYDNLNRLLTHEVPQPGAGPAIVTNYQYDLAGRTTLISDTAAHSLSFGFDSAKRVTSVAQLAPGLTTPRTINYVLDDAGNKTRAVWADGYFVDYDFDPLGRMATVRENGTFVLATYLYDALSRRTALVYGNGTRADTSFTTQGDMLTLVHTITGSGAVYTNSFTKAHQLASESVSNAAWAYVPAVFETTSYSPANQLNQYVNVTKGANPTVTLGYDQNGNLTGDGTWTYVYDAENRLMSATSAGMVATYQYDPLGRRQAKTANGVTTSYLSDGDEEIAEYDGAGNLLRRYIPGPGTDQPIAMVTPSGSSHLHSYFHTNRQGSTVAMSNDAGTVSEGPYTYDAYGSGAPSTGVPFKYTGRRLDAETGLYYYRARYYSASLGRFLQTDPVGYGAGLNMYTYASSDPINRHDPFGTTDLDLYQFGKFDKPSWKSIGEDFDIPGMFTVGGHGAPDDYGQPQAMSYNSEVVWDPDDLVRQIIAGNTGRQPVFLLICDWGVNSEWGTWLARSTGVNVWAPNKWVWNQRSGSVTRIWSAAMVKNHKGERTPDNSNPGVWKEYDELGPTGVEITEVTWNHDTNIVTYKARVSLSSGSINRGRQKHYRQYVPRIRPMSCSGYIKDKAPTCKS